MTPSDEEVVRDFKSNILNCYPDGAKVSPDSVMKTAHGFFLKALRSQRKDILLSIRKLIADHWNMDSPIPQMEAINKLIEEEKRV